MWVLYEIADRLHRGQPSGVWANRRHASSESRSSRSNDCQAGTQAIRCRCWTWCCSASRSTGSGDTRVTDNGVRADAERPAGATRRLHQFPKLSDNLRPERWCRHQVIGCPDRRSGRSARQRHDHRRTCGNSKLSSQPDMDTHHWLPSWAGASVRQAKLSLAFTPIYYHRETYSSSMDQFITIISRMGACLFTETSARSGRAVNSAV